MLSIRTADAKALKQEARPIQEISRSQLITAERYSAKIKRGEEVSRVILRRLEFTQMRIENHTIAVNESSALKTTVHPTDTNPQAQHARTFRCCLQKHLPLVLSAPKSPWFLSPFFPFLPFADHSHLHLRLTQICLSSTTPVLDS